MRVASNKPFVPELFDRRPISRIAGPIPAPPDRPYRLGEWPREIAAVPQPAPTLELAAAARPQPVHIADEPQASPISAYAPVRYDGGAVMRGRGLY